MREEDYLVWANRLAILKEVYSLGRFNYHKLGSYIEELESVLNKTMILKTPKPCEVGTYINYTRPITEEEIEFIKKCM